MKFHPMKKREVIAAWASLIRDIEKHDGWGPRLRNAPMETRCLRMLSLLHASVRVSNLRTFSKARAKAWAGEVAAKVQEGAP